jgi:hypothetical protein
VILPEHHIPAAAPSLIELAEAANMCCNTC